jgi:signal transduction histidine kinase
MLQFGMGDRSMIQAWKYRRRLTEAGAVVTVTLCLAFLFVFRSAAQAEALHRRITQTQDILRLVARVQLETQRLRDGVWQVRATRNPDRTGRFPSDLRDLQEDMGRLRMLTADDPLPQNILAEASALISGQSEKAREPAAAPAAIAPGASGDRQESEEPSDRLPALLDRLEAKERTQLAKRSAAVQANARQTQTVLAIAGLLTVLLLLASGYLIQREFQTLATVERGLRHAQELLSVKYEEQSAELGQAMEDLHAQICARRQAEDAIRDLNADLEKRLSRRTTELQEMNLELDAFSYSVSHDLRAPLRDLDRSSRTLQQEYGSELPDKAQQYLNRIGSAATHLSELVEDLLRLSRIGRQLPQRTRCSLRQLVEEARAEALEESEGRKIVWRIYSLPEVKVDPPLLRQALANLFTNAVTFTRQQHTAVIEVGSLEENGMNVVFVRDNGAGFDPRDADKLFGVFQRLHGQEEFARTGIGLATVQRIIRKHGGRVWSESVPRQGATVYFSLPICSHHSPESEEIIGAMG